jgi:hypothetical protein
MPWLGARNSTSCRHVSDKTPTGNGSEFYRSAPSSFTSGVTVWLQSVNSGCCWFEYRRHIALRLLMLMGCEVNSPGFVSCNARFHLLGFVSFLPSVSWFLGQSNLPFYLFLVLLWSVLFFPPFYPVSVHSTNPLVSHFLFYFPFLCILFVLGNKTVGIWICHSTNSAPRSKMGGSFPTLPSFAISASHLDTRTTFTKTLKKFLPIYVPPDPEPDESTPHRPILFI